MQVFLEETFNIFTPSSVGKDPNWPLSDLVLLTSKQEMKGRNLDKSNWSDVSGETLFSLAVS